MMKLFCAFIGAIIVFGSGKFFTVCMMHILEDDDKINKRKISKLDHECNLWFAISVSSFIAAFVLLGIVTFLNTHFD